MLRRQQRTQKRLSRLVGQVVAFDDRNARTRQTEFCGQTKDVRGGAARIGCAEIADDGNPVTQAIGQDRTQLLVEEWLVTGRGIGPFGELRVRERTFCQVLENQRGRFGGCDQCTHDGSRRIHAIPRAARGASDQQVFHPSVRVDQPAKDEHYRRAAWSLSN